ncbi:uncharacterized protein [Elaeis guineensis]|uniref:Uncharacterized protein LOC114912915 n=1 Tax=Elaeis guineensis var. tenera TaxID=51953 RepID=A0A8N4EQW9_ELAGV|nr:uncharacterized protein LOC114912915 [Elaeis guineensis]
MLFDTGIEKVEGESSTRQKKRMITSLVWMGHYVIALINRLSDIEMELAKAHEKRKAAETSEAKANVAAVEVQSKVEAAEAEVAHLKKVLEEAKASKAKVAYLASKKERWQEVQAKVAEAEKVEDRAAEARCKVMEAFHASEEFSQEKIDLS